MNPLRSIARDLVERKLWPVAALLVLALVAVPVLFLRPSDGSQGANVIAPPAADAAPVATTSGTSTTTTTPAAKSDVPPTLASLLGGDKPPKVKLSTKGPLSDPFQPPVQAKKAAAPSATTAQAAARTSAAPTTSSSSSSSTSTSTSTSRPTSTPATTTTDTPFTPSASNPGTPTTITPAKPTPVVPATTPVPAAGSSKTLAADIRFGLADDSPVSSDVARLSPFPTKNWPLVLFLGITGDKGRAAFLVTPSATVDGTADCRPTPALCHVLILGHGDLAHLTVPTSKGPRVFSLQLVAIRVQDAATPAEAQQSRDRQSVSGGCILHAIGAYGFNSEQGTLDSNTDKTDCQYQDPQPTTSLPALK